MILRHIADSDLRTGIKMNKKAIRFNLFNAMEWGYKAHERGINIQKARIEFDALLDEQ